MGNIWTRMAVAAALAVPVVATSPELAHAQLQTTGVGVVEYDTNETLLLLAGVTMGPGGAGWSPVFGVQAHYLTYDRGLSDNADIFSVRPSVGMRYGFSGGAMQVRGGYAFTSDDDDDGAPPTTVAEDFDDGVFVSAGVDYWGSGTGLGYQLLGSYNFGSEALWTRGRVTTRIASSGANGQIRLGAEAAYQTSDDFDALQPGGVIEWHRGSGLILSLGAGVKLIEQDGIDDPIYVRGEVILPFRR
jgi:hypothetical protein